MKNINKGLLHNFFVTVLVFTVVFSPSLSLAQTNTTSSQVSSLEAMVKLLQEKINILNGKSGTSNSVVSKDAQISLVKTTSSKATGKYSNVPAKSYVSLLWQDAEGQWNEVGQRTLPKKGGKGQVVVKLTGRDSLTGSAPEGMFKFRLLTTGNINWYRDSDTFTMGSDIAKPSCTLEVSDEYPGDSGEEVVLSWTSENADYATMRFEAGNSVSSAKTTRVKTEGDKTVRPNVSGTYHFIFYNKGGATKCTAQVNYKA